MIQTIRGASSLLDEFFERSSRRSAPTPSAARDRFGVGVERDNFVVRIAMDAVHHVAAHLAESDETDLNA